MSSSTVSKGMEGWEKRIDSVKVSKAHLNNLVMNYLIVEGYEGAAKKFAQEANISAHFHYHGINERVNIRNAIHGGDIKSAIEMINDLNPQVLDDNPILHFALLRLQLIELIRICNSSSSGDVTPAIEFARLHLAPRAPANKEFLNDLERAMTLICLPEDSPQMADLVDPSLRRNIAIRVNQAILEAEKVSTEAKVRGLVHLRAYAGNELFGGKEALRKEFPKLDLGIVENGRT